MYSKLADDGPNEIGSNSFFDVFEVEPLALYVSMRFTAFVLT